MAGQSRWQEVVAESMSAPLTPGCHRIVISVQKSPCKHLSQSRHELLCVEVRMDNWSGWGPDRRSCPTTSFPTPLKNTKDSGCSTRSIFWCFFWLPLWACIAGKWCLAEFDQHSTESKAFRRLSRHVWLLFCEEAPLKHWRFAQFDYQRDFRSSEAGTWVFPCVIQPMHRGGAFPPSFWFKQFNSWQQQKQKSSNTLKQIQ